jgi:hypothetical protein
VTPDTIFQNSTWSPVAEGAGRIDKVLVAGIPTPGNVQFKGLASPREYQEMAAAYQDAAFLLYKGSKLAEFSLILKLYTEGDWADWYTFLPIVQRLDPFAKRAHIPKVLQSADTYEEAVGTLALTVDHPFLAMHKIFAAVILDVAGPLEEAKGVYSFEIKCKEQRNPRPVNHGKADTARKGETQTEAQQLIERLNDLNSQKASELESLRNRPRSKP